VYKKERKKESCSCAGVDAGKWDSATAVLNQQHRLAWMSPEMMLASAVLQEVQ
jgi:hypothetical protein